MVENDTLRVIRKLKKAKLEKAIAKKQASKLSGKQAASFLMEAIKAAKLEYSRK